MRTITVQERRRRLVRQHYLDGGATSPEAVVDALVALHATDPASVYLAVLARSAASTLADVSEAMYVRRNLVRWMAVRRTLFLFARADIPTVQAAVSTPVAAMLRRQLVGRLERNATEPPIDGDIGDWLTDLEDRVEHRLRARKEATGAQLGADVPGLRTRIPPGAPSDRPQNVTSALLTLMSAEGRIVRGVPAGAWTSRHHRWEPAEHWWPTGLPRPEKEESQRHLAWRWLARFGPATVEDLQWWTGWNKSDIRRALNGVHIEEVDLHGQLGIALQAWQTTTTITPERHRWRHCFPPSIPPRWAGRAGTGSSASTAGRSLTALATSVPRSGGTARSSGPGRSAPQVASAQSCWPTGAQRPKPPWTRPRPCCTTVSKVQSSRPRSARPSSARSRTASPLPGPPDL